MTALDNTPTNQNFLNPLNFVFRVKRAPHVNFFIQRINLPSLSFDYAEQGNPFTSIPIQGDHIHFGNLDITFKVDEDLQNWFEIHNWIRSLGFPDNFTEFQQIKANTPTSGDGITADLMLIILNAVKLPIYEVQFWNAFPISLSELTFDSTDESVNYITATASFRYIYYSVNKIV